MFTPPDWRDPNAYSDIRDASLVRIAWEFLRRNPFYHQAWAEYSGHLRRLAAADPDVARYAELLLSPNPTREMFDALGDGERLAHLSGRLGAEPGMYPPVPGVPGRTRRLDFDYGSKWGLAGMLHPMRPYSFMAAQFSQRGDVVSSPTSYGLRLLEDELGTRGTLTESKWLVLQIDLSLPLEVIEAAVMRYIKEEREFRAEKRFIEPVRRRALAKHRYVEYLRLLDGAAAGASISDIGQCLAPRANNAAPDRPRDKRFRAALNEAERLRDGGYRALPLLQKSDSTRKKK